MHAPVDLPRGLHYGSSVRGARHNRTAQDWMRPSGAGWWALAQPGGPLRAAGARLQLLLLFEDDVHELALVALGPPPLCPSGSTILLCNRHTTAYTPRAELTCRQHAQTLAAVMNVAAMGREARGPGGSTNAWVGARQQGLRVRGELGQRDAHAVRPARDAQPAQLPVDDRLAHVQCDRRVLHNVSIQLKKMRGSPMSTHHCMRCGRDRRAGGAAAAPLTRCAF